VHRWCWSLQCPFRGDSSVAIRQQHGIGHLQRSRRRKSEPIRHQRADWTAVSIRRPGGFLRRVHAERDAERGDVFEPLALVGSRGVAAHQSGRSLVMTDKHDPPSRNDHRKQNLIHRSRQIRWPRILTTCRNQNPPARCSPGATGIAGSKGAVGDFRFARGARRPRRALPHPCHAPGAFGRGVEELGGSQESRKGEGNRALARKE